MVPQMPRGPFGGGGGWGGLPVHQAPMVPQVPVQPPMAPQAPFEPPVQQPPVEPPPVRQQPVQPPIQQQPVEPPPVRQMPQEPTEQPPVHQEPQPVEPSQPQHTLVQVPVQQTPVQREPEAPATTAPVHTPPSEQPPTQHNVTPGPTTPVHTPVTEPQQTPQEHTSVPVTSPQGTPAAPTPPTKQVGSPQPSATPNVPKPGGSPQPVTAVTSAPQPGGPTAGPSRRQVSQVPAPPPVKADPGRVEEAKNAPPVIADPVKPPPPPPGPAQAMLAGDMTSHLDRAVNNPNRQVDVVRDGENAVIKPQHWDYQDYDLYHQPRFYNPLNVPLRIHYFYQNAYRDLVVPALGLAVLAVADAGVYPYTAVGGDDYVTSGYFDGGAWVPPPGWDGPPPSEYAPPAPPPSYNGVTAYVPAADQNVGLDKVTLVGHDDNAPVGQQDTMMLNDTTLAWGQADDPKDGGHVTIQKTQPTPGVGPTDDGRSIILAAKQQPINNGWQKWMLGGILAVVAAVGAGALWIVRHPKTAPEESTEPVGDEGPSLGSLVETPTDMHSGDTMADPDHTTWQRP